MKPNRLIWALVILFSVVAIQLLAQENEANRAKFEEIKTKAEAGDAAAQGKLGYCYLTGFGVAKDVESGIKWFQKVNVSGTHPKKFV